MLAMMVVVGMSARAAMLLASLKKKKGKDG